MGDQYADQDSALQKDMDAEVEEHLMAEEAAMTDEKPEDKYKKSDFDVEGWDAKIKEEEGKWHILGVTLNQMTFTGTELFYMQCRLQALINCGFDGDFSEENMNLNLKLCVMTSMEAIRESLEPQLAQMKIAALKAGNLKAPNWAKDHGRGNGS